LRSLAVDLPELVEVVQEDCFFVHVFEGFFLFVFVVVFFEAEGVEDLLRSEYLGGLGDGWGVGLQLGGCDGERRGLEGRRPAAVSLGVFGAAVSGGGGVVGGFGVGLLVRGVGGAGDGRPGELGVQFVCQQDELVYDFVEVAVCWVRAGYVPGRAGRWFRGLRWGTCF